jgi:hypothetical protein
MLVFLTFLGWLSHAGVAPRQAPLPDILHCRIELAAGAESRRCSVAAPAGRAVRVCGDADRRAGHCDTRVGKGRYVAWVTGTGPGRCRITDQRTKWKRGIVSAKLSRSAGAPSTCDLYVALR